MKRTIRTHLVRFLLLCAAVLFNTGAWAQVSFTPGNLTISQNLDALPASGSPTFTQNSTIVGIYGERTGTGTTIVANEGNGTAGALYSYGTGTTADRALGSVGSGGTAAGDFTYGFRLKNETGSTITSLRVQYTGEQWRNSAAAAQTVNFSYLISNTVIATTPAQAVPAGYVADAGLDFTSPITGGTAGALNGNLAANRSAKDVTLSVSIPAGSEIMLRWYDQDHPGSDHGLAIDDLIITAALSVPPATLTANPATLSGFAATQGQTSPPQVYTLTGSNLTTNASVSVSTGFEVSTDGSTYSTTTTVPQTSGSLSQTIAVRLTSTAPAGGVSGTVTNVSGSATATVSVSGNVTAPTPGKIVISQIYGGGGNSGATFTNDFIELFNSGGTAVSVTGWTTQYASATSTSWQSTTLTGSIAPGKYYLVQQAAGTAGTTALPTPDAIGTINLSGTVGKVALVNVTAALSGACPLGSTIIDFVGFGTTANCFEGSGATPAPSNTNAVFRASNGCTDTNNNAADFATGAPNPRNSASPANVCTVVPPTSPVLTATPNALNIAYTQGSGPASATVSVSGSNLNTASGTVTAASSSTAFVVSPASVPFSGSALTSTIFTVSLVAGLTTVASPYSATITFAGGGATALVPVTGTVSAPVPNGITPIATARTQVGQTVTIQGTVTVSGQLGTKQLYVEDNTGGVLVYSGPGDDYTTQAQIGDVVKLTGPVSVYQGGVEINGVTAFTLVSTGNPAPVPTPITLDQIGNYQGRLVRITGVSVTPASPTFSAGNVTLNADNTTGTLRIGTNSGLVGAGQPSAPFSITGIADRFVQNVTTTGSDNVQLLPRLLGDVEGATPPVFEDVFCGTPITSGTLTQDKTFDFAAFNIEFFGASAGTINCPNGNLQYQNQGPSNESLQAQNVKKVLMAINADVFVLEEVSDQALLQSNLPAGYALSCSNRFSYYFQDECTQTPTNGFVFGPTKFAQKVCVAYNTTTVTSVSASPLLSDYYGYPTNIPTNSAPSNWSSGRLPYLFVADATINGVTRRLNIIGIHAKSGSATADYTRRKQDVLDLYNLLTNSPNGPGPLGAGFTKENIIIAGDYNDNITGSIATNQPSTYKPFVDDVASFTALTQPLEDEQGCNTFFNAAGNTSFLDHIVISNELFNAYVPNSVGIQTSFSAITTNFTNTTSDHRPVYARFDLSKIAGPLSATLLASTSVCAGSPANFSLTVAGLATGNTYSYTISNGTNSTTALGVSASAVQTSVVPTVAGSFTATVLTSTNASTTAASGTVAINALPTNASLTTGTLTCTQTSVTLTASAAGGASYTLTNGTTSQTNTTGQFVVSTAGIYKAIIANASGCTATATATVTSNTAVPTATLVASSMSACAPASITLTAGGGTSYTFSAGATQIGMTNQAVVTQSGTYSVMVSNGSSCTATASVSVTVNTPPAAPTLTGVSRTVNTSPTPLPLTQFVNATGSNPLSFSGMNGALNPPNADISQPGTQSFSVTQTNASGCVSAATLFTITVQTGTPTTPGDQTVCVGTTATINAGAGAAGAQYAWFRNSQLASGKLAETPSVRGTTTTSLTLVGVQTSANYYLRVTTGSTITWIGPIRVTVTANCGGRLAATEPEQRLTVTLTPNPIQDGWLEAIVTGAGGQRLNLQLHDLHGKLIEQQQWQQADVRQPVRWNVSQQPTGLYLMQATTDQQVQRLKVIKP